MASFTDFLTKSFLDANPSAALFNAFPQAGGTGHFADFIRNSQSRLYNSYLGGLPNNPNMLFPDFLKGQDLMGQFQALAPSQRGANPAMFNPRVRYIGF